MKNGLEVKNISFGELRRISSEEFRNSTGLGWTWDGLIDGADVELTIINCSREVKEAYIYTVSIADIPSAPQHSWGNYIEVKPGAEKQLNYLFPMHGVSSSDYGDYTGPLRYAVEVTVSETDSWKVILEKVKYYDIPAKVKTDALKDKRYNIHRAINELERTVLLHDLHIDGNPKEGLNSIEAKLLNFGDKTQYIGIDTRAERKNRGYQTQFFFEVKPGEEITVDIGSYIAKECSGLGYLRIRAASIPEKVFRSERGRSSFLGEVYMNSKDSKCLIAKFDLYFSESSD